MTKPTLEALEALLTGTQDTIVQEGDKFVVTFNVAPNEKAVRLYVEPTILQTEKGFEMGPHAVRVASSAGIPSKGFLDYFNAFERAASFARACGITGEYAVIEAA